MLLVGTPGLTTTISIWSSSHEGTSPASSLTTPSSPLSASASFDQSMKPLRSFRTTNAPRAARKREAATPLRPAPMIRTFLPSTSIGLVLPAKAWRRACPPALKRDSLIKGVPRKKDFRRFAARVGDDVNALPPLKFLEQLVAFLDLLARRLVRAEESQQLVRRERRDDSVVGRVRGALHVENRARAVGVRVFERLFNRAVLRARRRRVRADRKLREPDRGVVAARAELALAQLLQRRVYVRLVLDEIEPGVSAHLTPSAQL